MYVSDKKLTWVQYWYTHNDQASGWKRPGRLLFRVLQKIDKYNICVNKEVGYHIYAEHYSNDKRFSIKQTTDKAICMTRRRLTRLG